MTTVQAEMLSIIEARRSLGLFDVFFAFLRDCDQEFLHSEGFDVVQSGEGFYVYY